MMDVDTIAATVFGGLVWLFLVLLFLILCGLALIGLLEVIAALLETWEKF